MLCKCEYIPISTWLFMGGGYKRQLCITLMRSHRLKQCQYILLEYTCKYKYMSVFGFLDSMDARKDIQWPFGICGHFGSKHTIIVSYSVYVMYTRHSSHPRNQKRPKTEQVTIPKVKLICIKSQITWHLLISWKHH